MDEELRTRTFTEAPSFVRIGDTLPDSPIVELEVACDDDLPMNDFEFSFTLDESEHDALTTIAGEINSKGQVLPAYPVFNQNLVADSSEASLEQELVEMMGRVALPFEKHDLRSGSASSSSSIDDPTEYCAWTPRSAPLTPDRWRMSQSVGSETSEFRRFRLRDLIVGRSRSDGKEKLMVYSTAEKEIGRGGFGIIPCHSATTAKKVKQEMGKGKGNRKEKEKCREVKEMDVVTAHRIYYGKGAVVGRRSFLPYRPGLLGGFFGHGLNSPF
ncbi:uncharacterized protein LOC110099282 [Dendrobium catenatum]|uniref:Uncharacterized protein n=1 Tax=Dendrobium catenatum TaxID=906689 RepID=A0A2I0W9P8_9ASPA|nr:uncharacterized protein LOC110099282 [Dendrobium catenatum]PKU72374.1 hypothetical protein MA16_Dca025577 [Dendrobium catenatum]